MSAEDGRSAGTVADCANDESEFVDMPLSLAAVVDAAQKRRLSALLARLNRDELYSVVRLVTTANLGWLSVLRRAAEDGVLVPDMPTVEDDAAGVEP